MVICIHLGGSYLDLALLQRCIGHGNQEQSTTSVHTAPGLHPYPCPFSVRSKESISKITATRNNESIVRVKLFCRGTFDDQVSHPQMQ